MNELADQFWPFIKVLILPYVLFMFLLCYPIDFSVTAPGGLSDVSQTIQVEGDQTASEGTFFTTYVMSLPRPTFFEFIVGYFSDYTTLSVLSTYYANYTNAEISAMAMVDKDVSVDAAIIAAYRAAYPLDPSDHINYATQMFVVGKTKTILSHYDEIAFGDRFISMTGEVEVVVYPDLGGSDACAVGETDQNGDGKCNTTDLIYGVTVAGGTYAFSFENQNGVPYVLELTRDVATGVFGISFLDYEVVLGDPTPTVTVENSSIGGPSGGLLQTLAIYDMITEGDLTHGLKIAGTGTIDADGKVGQIGGIRQKIITAYLFGADLFFVPDPNREDSTPEDDNDNYAAALATCEEFGFEPEGWLVPVASFQEALSKLEELGD